MTIRIRSGEETRQAIEFSRGTLVLHAEPWARVSLDGKPLGRTPLETVEVMEGAHQLRFVNPDLGKDETRRVTVRPNSQEIVSVVWQ
jgi:hypothetical protein